MRSPDLEERSKTTIREILEQRKTRGQTSLPSTTDVDYYEFGVGFFTWLARYVEKSFKSGTQNLPALAQIPVRITLPSFGAYAAEASLLLSDILYSTDFGLVGYDLNDLGQLTEPLRGQVEGRRRIQDYSQPFGVQDLDRDIFEALCEEDQ